MKNINWGNVEEAKEFERPAPGGYICGITAVEDFPQKEYIKLEYDFAEGTLKNYWRDLYTNKGFWGGNFVKSYKETARSFFKGFLTAIEKSNSGFTANSFDGDINKLKRKMIGLVLGEEEYINKDNEIKTRLYVADVRSVDAIRKGDFKVPELKRAKDKPVSTAGTSPAFEVVDSGDDLPF